MKNIQFVNDILEIDVDGRSFVIPTNDNTKLKKYNEFTLDGNKTGYVDETLLPDDNPDTGLLWMAYPILYFADDTKKEITSYLFSERPHKIIIENGLVSVEVSASGLVYKDVTRWANQTKDSDADDRPDVYDRSVEGSLAWLYASTEFNYNWQIKYSLTNSVITNDFGIGAGDIDIFPFGISGGNRLYDSGGNILTKEESVPVDGGTVDLYDVKGLTEVRETDRPGNNAGDCKVYDGATRVYDTSHTFTGNAKFTNDDITVEISATKVYFYSKDYTKSEDTYIDSPGPAFSITSISPDKIVFVLDGNSCYLSRGLPYLQMEISSGQPYLHTTNQYIYFSDGDLLDDDEQTAGPISKADIQYAVALDPANSVIFFMGVATETVSTDATGGSGFTSLKSQAGETWQAVGILPYPYDIESTYASGDEVLSQSYSLSLPDPSAENDIVSQSLDTLLGVNCGISIGLQRLASDLWLPVKIKDGIVIETGLSPLAPSQDGDTAVMAVYLDSSQNVRWGYIWKDGSSDVMSANGDGAISTPFVPSTDFGGKSCDISIKLMFPTVIDGYIYGASIDANRFYMSIVNEEVRLGLGSIAQNFSQISPGKLYEILLHFDSGSYTISINGVLSTGSYLENFPTLGLYIMRDYASGISLPSGIIYSFTVDIENVRVCNYTNTGATDADWIDRSGNGNDGTVYGSPITTSITGEKPSYPPFSVEFYEVLAAKNALRSLAKIETSKEVIKVNR